MEKIATEAGHWYLPDGTPFYTYVNKKGKESPVTLRQARPVKAKPSVTSILSIIDKPGLNKWREGQNLMAALTLPKIEGESLDDFAKRAIEDAKEHARQAREKGTLWHGIIERYFAEEAVDPEYLNMCNAVDKALCEHFGETEIYGIRWKIEKSFVHYLGFGGKVDLHSGGLVLDLKTKEFDEKNKPEKYPEQLWQLSAYKYGLGLPEARIANVFVSTSNLGLVHIKEWSQEESEAGWEAFKAIFRAWIHIKKYDPGETLEF